MNFGDFCLYCPHTRNDHSLPGRVCAVCRTERDGMPYEPGEEWCESFTSSRMCGICGGRMTWHSGLNQYFHTTEADDEDHEAEPRTRRPRKRT